MQDRTERRNTPAPGWAMTAAGALAGAAMVLAAGTMAAGAADMAPITQVGEDSPKSVTYDCEGVKNKVTLELREDVAEDFYIQLAGSDVMIPVTCATATTGLSATDATISCNKAVKGAEPMAAVDGRDLADALAKALGAASCRRVK